MMIAGSTCRGWIWSSGSSAGDKRTSFVGSHFFYEDVSGRNPAEDRFELLETTDRYYRLRATPREPDSVEFDHYLLWIDRENLLPTRIDYLDARGEVYRRVEALKISEVQGYPTVTASRVSDLRSGGTTTMMFAFMQYDIGLNESLFSERSLRNPPRQWLRRPQ